LKIFFWFLLPYITIINISIYYSVEQGYYKSQNLFT